MSRHYHSCGYPIDAGGLEPGTHTWVYYGGNADPERIAATSCPRCGEPAVTDVLHAPPTHPATVLREWCVNWPDVRHTLDAAITARRKQDPRFYGYDAETLLREFDYLLRAVANLAEGLLVSTDSEALPHPAARS
jgi:hypothetical protein